jgi:ATP-dependent helicase/nuclease subunit B
MFDSPGPRLFALPPGVDFPSALVDGLRQRMADQPPEAMARVQLYVNTARMRRRIIDLFAAAGPGLLPRVRLVTDLAALTPGLPPPVPPLRRRLELAQLVGGLLQAQPDLAPRAALYDLADSLATLLDEMQGEGVSPDAIARLDVSDHSAHWQRTQAFMGIVAPFFTGPRRRGAAATGGGTADRALADRPAAGPGDRGGVHRIARHDGAVHAGGGAAAAGGAGAARL